MNYIVNSFSLQMLQGNINTLQVITLPEEMVADVIKHLEVYFAVGHKDTAVILANRLAKYGVVIDPSKVYNRESIRLSKGDSLYVFQVTGGRLPEGVTELPEGVKCEWKLVELEEL